MDAEALFHDISSRLPRSNMGWRSDWFATEFPGVYQIIVSRLAHAIGDATLVYIDSSLDTNSRELRVVAFTDDLRFEMVYTDDNSAVVVRSRRDITSLEMISAPIIRSEWGAPPVYLTFRAAYGLETIDFPLQSQTNSTPDQDALMALWAGLKNDLNRSRA
jgi:hypothetical protein